MTGRARFAADVVVANPIHAFLLLSAIPRGRIDRIDAAQARSLPGIIDIVTHENAPALAAPVSRSTGSSTSHQPLTAPDILFDGQIIAVVLAESFETAREAAAMVKVRYSAQAAAVTLDSTGADIRRWSDVNPAFRLARRFWCYVAGVSSANSLVTTCWLAMADALSGWRRFFTISAWRSAEDLPQHLLIA